MLRKQWLGVAVGVLLAGSAIVGAKSGATTRPTKLTKPWSELKDLSDEQVTKIHAFHEKALGEVHEIEAKEKVDCMEVLTDAQKKELEMLMVEDKKEAAERRLSGSTTKPAAK